METQAIKSYMEIGRQIDNAASLLIDCLLRRGIYSGGPEGRTSTVWAAAVEGEPYSLTVDVHHVRLVGKAVHAFYKDQFGMMQLIGAIEFRGQGVDDLLEERPLFSVYVDDESSCGWGKVAQIHRSVPTNPAIADGLRAAIFQELAGSVLDRLKQRPITDQSAAGFVDLGP